VEIRYGYLTESTFLLTHHRDFLYKITEQDAAIYERILPRDSKLLDAMEQIDWSGFEAKLEEFYAPKMGQPAYPPLVLFKIELLRYFYNLSDRQVIDRCWTDLLFRYFLQIGIQAKLPDPSVLTRFRGRLGAEGFGQLFDELIRQARSLGLVRDRLRLRRATTLSSYRSTVSASMVPCCVSWKQSRA
jgi:IS5 family transposase